MSKTSRPERMNKPDVLRAIAEKTGLTRASVDHVLFALTEEIALQARAGAVLYYPGLGTFTGKIRKATTLFTGMPELTHDVPRRRYVKFTPALSLKEMVEK